MPCVLKISLTTRQHLICKLSTLSPHLNFYTFLHPYISAKFMSFFTDVYSLRKLVAHLLTGNAYRYYIMWYY